MERLRSSWLALMGGTLLIALSISVAFGAGPGATLDASRGEGIAAFVHALIFATEPDGDAEMADPEADEDEDGSHGECVSKVARSDAKGGNGRGGGRP